MDKVVLFLDSLDKLASFPDNNRLDVDFFCHSDGSPAMFIDLDFGTKNDTINSTNLQAIDLVSIRIEQE